VPTLGTFLQPDLSREGQLVGSIVMETSSFSSPIVVVSADGEVMVFTDVGSAEAYMEPIDVRRGEYRAVYDASGEAFDVSVRTRRRMILGIFPVKHERIELVRRSEPPRPSDLIAALQKFLPRLGLSQEVVRRATLTELLELARERALHR
jgi:hypothetical protein